MVSIMKKLLAVLATILLLATPVFAQTSLSTTNLAAAVADTSSQFVTVASATGITAPGTGSTLTFLFIDGEQMGVRSVSGTTIGVSRGQNGTTATTHLANAFVYAGSPNAFTTVDPSGSCVAANQAFTPLINVRTRSVWNCAATATGLAVWQGWSTVPMFETSSRTSVAGVSYTILPTDYLVVLSTTLTGTGGTGVPVKSFTLPSHLGLAGKQIKIKDESGGVTATTLIRLIGTIDGTNSSVATVVQIVTPFGAVTLEAGSGGWFTVSCHGGNGSVVCR